MARAGSMNAPGPFNFRGCGLTAECLLAREMVRVRFPAAAPIFLQAARQHAPESPKLNSGRALAPPGGTEAACHSHFGVVADKQCTCPASKLMWERYPPTPPSFAWNREGCKGRMSSIGSAKEDSPRTGF